MKNKINIWFLILVLVLGLSLTNQPKVVRTEIITIKERDEGSIYVDLRNEYDLVVGVRVDIQTDTIKYKKL
jgi:hypothetical protein